jgi:hypothetical protein
MTQDMKPINDLESVQQATIEQLHKDLNKVYTFMYTLDTDAAKEFLKFMETGN